MFHFQKAISRSSCCCFREEFILSSDKSFKKILAEYFAYQGGGYRKDATLQGQKEVMRNSLQ